jgi:acyl-coenzyme A thioesterase PaaI-like protein
MDVTQLPFNRFVGLESAPGDSGFLVTLPDGPQYGNHLGTVHASALLAVAEAASGAFLIQQLGSPSGFIPVVRRLEAKFRKPARGRVSARCSNLSEVTAAWLAELAGRGRLIAPVAIEVVDNAGAVVLTAVVEWFIARGNDDA